MSKELISVIDVAKKLGIRKQTIFKALKRFGIDTIKQPHSEHRGQSIAYITIEESKRVVDHFKMVSDKNVFNSAQGPSPSYSSGYGVFYLIQLEPALDPGRFKLGFASSMPGRLRQLKCSAPHATIVKKWPCKELWEKTAIDCVSAGCEQIHTEVFKTDDIGIIMEKCDQFFSLMPPIKK